MHASYPLHKEIFATSYDTTEWPYPGFTPNPFTLLTASIIEIPQVVGNGVKGFRTGLKPFCHSLSSGRDTLSWVKSDAYGRFRLHHIEDS